MPLGVPPFPVDDVFFRDEGVEGHELLLHHVLYLLYLQLSFGLQLAGYDAHYVVYHLGLRFPAVCRVGAPYSGADLSGVEVVYRAIALYHVELGLRERNTSLFWRGNHWRAGGLGG